MPEQKVGLSALNDALLELGNKLDAGINRFEDKLEKEISGLKDIIIKRLQDENSIFL